MSEWKTPLAIVFIFGGGLALFTLLLIHGERHRAGMEFTKEYEFTKAICPSGYKHFISGNKTICFREVKK